MAVPKVDLAVVFKERGLENVYAQLQSAGLAKEEELARLTDADVDDLCGAGGFNCKVIDKIKFKNLVRGIREKHQHAPPHRIKNALILLIGISKYDNMDDLNGARRDVVNYRKLWEQKYGYRVLPEKGSPKWYDKEFWTFEDIENFIQEARWELLNIDKELVHDALIISINAHGNHVGILPSDYDAKDTHNSVPVRLSLLQGKVGASAHRKFAQIPRIFLVDACRGSGEADVDISRGPQLAHDSSFVCTLYGNAPSLKVRENANEGGYFSQCLIDELRTSVELDNTLSSIAIKVTAKLNDKSASRQLCWFDGDPACQQLVFLQNTQPQTHSSAMKQPSIWHHGHAHEDEKNDMPAQTVGLAVQQQHDASAQWRCSACTYANKQDITQCQMCGTIKGSSTHGGDEKYNDFGSTPMHHKEHQNQQTPPKKQEHLSPAQKSKQKQFEKFLESANMEQYAQKFRDSDCFDMQSIPLFDDEMLRDEVGIDKRMARKRFLNKCAQMETEMSRFEQMDGIEGYLWKRLSRYGVVTLDLLGQEVKQKNDIKTMFEIDDDEQCLLLWTLIIKYKKGPAASVAFVKPEAQPGVVDDDAKHGVSNDSEDEEPPVPQSFKEQFSRFLFQATRDKLKSANVNADQAGAATKGKKCDSLATCPSMQRISKALGVQIDSVQNYDDLLHYLSAEKNEALIDDWYHVMFVHFADVSRRRTPDAETPETPESHFSKFTTEVDEEHVPPTASNDNGDPDEKPYEKHGVYPVYSFGEKFAYDDKYKRDAAYVPRKYKNLAEEVVNNSIFTISLSVFKSGVVDNARQRAMSDTARSMRHCDNGAPITVDHLMCVLLYCNFTQLSREFSKTFRKIRKDETYADVHARNSEFANWSRLLRETVWHFGEEMKDSPLSSYFYGINKKMVFPSFFFAFQGPTSLTASREVAARFASGENLKLDGIILKLEKYDENLKFFNCSWLSCFANEDERLLIGRYERDYPMTMRTIICMQTGIDYSKFVRAFAMFNSCLRGQEPPQQQNARKGDVGITELMFKHFDDQTDDQKTFDGAEYVNALFDQFRLNLERIEINMSVLDRYYGSFSSLLFTEKVGLVFRFAAFCRVFINCTHVGISFSTRRDLDLICNALLIELSEAVKFIGTRSVLEVTFEHVWCDDTVFDKLKTAKFVQNVKKIKSDSISMEIVPYCDDDSDDDDDNDWQITVITASGATAVGNDPSI